MGPIAGRDRTIAVPYEIIEVRLRRKCSYGGGGSFCRTVAERSEKDIGKRVEPFAHRNHIAVHHSGVRYIHMDSGDSAGQFDAEKEQGEFRIRICLQTTEILLPLVEEIPVHIPETAGQ